MPDANWSFWRDEAQFSFFSTASRLRVGLSLLGGLVAIVLGGILGPSVGVPAILSWVVSALVIPLVLLPANIALDLYSKGEKAGTALKKARDEAVEECTLLRSPRAELSDVKQELLTLCRAANGVQMTHGWACFMDWYDPTLAKLHEILHPLKCDEFERVASSYMEGGSFHNVSNREQQAFTNCKSCLERILSTLSAEDINRRFRVQR